MPSFKQRTCDDPELSAEGNLISTSAMTTARVQRGVGKNAVCEDFSLSRTDETLLQFVSFSSFQTEGVLFLCKDDLPTSEYPSTPEADTDVTSLMQWWNQHVAGVDGGLSLPLMKDIVSR